MQFTLTVKSDNGSEQQLELGKAVYFHPHYSIFEQIRNDALDTHVGSVNIGSKIITNLRFPDDIDGLAGSESY